MTVSGIVESQKEEVWGFLPSTKVSEIRSTEQQLPRQCGWGTLGIIMWIRAGLEVRQWWWGLEKHKFSASIPREVGVSTEQRYQYQAHSGCQMLARKAKALADSLLLRQLFDSLLKAGNLFSHCTQISPDNREG